MMPSAARTELMLSTLPPLPALIMALTAAWVGTSVQRLVYHYRFHIGEAHAIRQPLGHAELPDFVGRLGLAAPYRPA